MCLKVCGTDVEWNWSFGILQYIDLEVLQLGPVAWAVTAFAFDGPEQP